MATRYAVASGDFSDNVNVWSDTDGGAAGAFKPVDGDTFVILVGVNVKMDEDQSAWTGLDGVNIIRGHATTPGMLYFSDGDNGYLKLRAGATLVGSSGTVHGRLLANSNGTWGGTTELSASNTATIHCASTSANQIDAQFLDIQMYAAAPTNKYVTCYGSRYTVDTTTDVNTSTDVIDIGASVANGTTVRVRLISGALPTGLDADAVYYVRGTAGNTIKLAYMNQDLGVVDITATGSGTFYVYTGVDSTTTAVNVFEDVTSDEWAVADHVMLCHPKQSTTPETHRSTIATGGIAAGAITIDDATTADFNAGTVMVLGSRNISILSYLTSAADIVDLDYTAGTVILDCAVIATTSDYGTVFGGSGHPSRTTTAGAASVFFAAGYGADAASSPMTLSGVMVGCGGGAYEVADATCSSTSMFFGCGYAVRGEGDISGLVYGCGYGCQYTGASTCDTAATSKIIGGTAIASYGTHRGSCYFSAYGVNSALVPVLESTFSITGAVTGMQLITGAHIRGCSIVGCSSAGMYGGTRNRGVVTISQCPNGIQIPTDYRLSATISNCTTGVTGADGLTLIDSTIDSCTNGITIAYELELRDVTISNCTTGLTLHTGRGRFDGVTFTSNTTDVTPFSDARLVPFHRCNGSDDQLLSWHPYLDFEHETVEVPGGDLDFCQKITFNTGVTPNQHIEWEVPRSDNGTISIDVHAKHDSTGLSATERVTWALTAAGNDPILNTSESYLDSWTAADSTSWQNSTLTYARTDNRPVFIRQISARASGSNYILAEDPTFTPTGGTGVVSAFGGLVK